MIFVAKPDYYGRFGHQLLRHLLPVILADLLKGRFLPQKLIYSAHRFSELIDLSAHPLATESMSGDVSQIRVANDGINEKFDTHTTTGAKGFMNDVIKAMNKGVSIVILPFDQHPGIIEKHLANIRQSLWPMVITSRYREIALLIDQSEEVITKPTARVNIRIHLRRGDISSNGIGKNMYVSDEDVIRCLRYIATREERQCFVNLYTQGSASSYEDLLCTAGLSANDYRINSDDSVWTNDAEVEHFVALTRPCDYLIGSYSSFFRLACLFNQSSAKIMVLPGVNGHDEEYKDARALYQALGAKFL